MLIGKNGQVAEQGHNAVEAEDEDPAESRVRFKLPQTQSRGPGLNITNFLPNAPKHSAQEHARSLCVFMTRMEITHMKQNIYSSHLTPEGMYSSKN